MIGLPPAFMLVSCSAYSSTLKMEAICSSYTSVDFQWAAWYYIREDSTLSDTIDILEMPKPHLLKKF
jgi:hypothetical protein